MFKFFYRSTHKNKLNLCSVSGSPSSHFNIIIHQQFMISPGSFDTKILVSRMSYVNGDQSIEANEKMRQTFLKHLFGRLFEAFHI